MWKSFPTTATLQRCNKRGQRHACMNYAERTAVSTKSTLQRSNKRGQEKSEKVGQSFVYRKRNVVPLQRETKGDIKDLHDPYKRSRAVSYKGYGAYTMRRPEY